MVLSMVIFVIFKFLFGFEDDKFLKYLNMMDILLLLGGDIFVLDGLEILFLFVCWYLF